jgi:S1-C subfamily serine protease
MTSPKYARFRSPAYFCRRWSAVLLLVASLVIGTEVAHGSTRETRSKPAPLLGDGPNEAKFKAVESSVIKVFSSVRYPDVYKPWTKQAPMEVVGSGAVIEGKRILCNAHLVLYASEVQVQADQAADRISATVEAMAPAIDLAVLKLDDEAFFESHPPLRRAKTLPAIKDDVVVYGYPKGGTSLSVTKGIVSRIEYYPPFSGLWVQIDAAVNPGNSGGPVMVGDEMIGLIVSRLRGSDNIGYIIPAEEIDLYLQDIADGRYDGKPAMLGDIQTLENPALRSFLELGQAVEGVVVHHPGCNSVNYPLKKWDVITRIGDTPIDNQGMVELTDANLRVRFRYLVPKLAKNGKVLLTVFRAGKEHRVEVPVVSKRSLLIPSLEGAYPSYFVFGPLVFSSATIEFVAGLSKNESSHNFIDMLSARASLLVRRMGDMPAFEGEQLVVVASPFFPSKIARGYDNPFARVVKAINGVPVKNLAHLVQLLRDSQDEFITIDFDIRGSETLVFPRRQMVAATDAILTDNGVLLQGSPDTLAIWKAKTSHVAFHE